MRRTEPDPSDELFDIVDSEGNPTGEVKPRSGVHRDGDWHCSFHCWFVTRLPDGSPALIFQRRSARKDTHPGFLDVSVGGHYRSGEGFDEVVREIEEELGVAPSPDALVRIGRRWSVGTGPTWLDREIQDVYVFELRSDPSTLQPSFEEITALDVVRLTDLEELFNAARNPVRSTRYAVRPDDTLDAPEDVELTADDFIPVQDGYWLAGARAAVQVMEGAHDVRLELR